MDFEITNERKKEICNQVLVGLMTELYYQLTYLGIDSDTFSAETYEEPNDLSLKTSYAQITKVVEKINFLNTKIESLG